MKKLALILTIGFIAYSCDKPQTENTVQEETVAVVEETEEEVASAEEPAEEAAPAKEATPKLVKMSPRGTIYKGYSPSEDVTEWIQIAYNDDVTEIVGIWMWSNLDMEKTQMEIVEQNYYSDEGINGATGKFKYPGSQVITGFSSFEETLTMEYADGSSQDFTYESFEE